MDWRDLLDVADLYQDPFPVNDDIHTPPAHFKDLGWQLHRDNSDEVRACQDSGHKTESYDNSYYRRRGTNTVIECKLCQHYYHIDSSD